MSDLTLEHIEAKLDSLIRRCNQLERENAELTASQASLQEERVRIIEKNDQARERVTAMINLLKNLAAENEQQAS